MPPEGECTHQKQIPSNLTLFESNTVSTRSQKRARTEELDNIKNLVKSATNKNQKAKTTRRKNPAVAPVQHMVPPYTPQQFFDQPANITNGQLLAMNPKFSLQVVKQLRKPVVRKRKEEEQQDESMEGVQSSSEGKDSKNLLINVHAAGYNNQRSTALYCTASIKNIEFPLIIDTGSAGSIISLALLKDLDMEITKASRTVMVNVNGERRRPLGAVSEIPLVVMGQIIPMDAIVTDANSYSAIVGNDWLRKTKAAINMNNHSMVLQWKGRTIEVPIESQDMPQHKVNIEAPITEEIVEEEDEEEYEEQMQEQEDDDDSEEEYEDETNLCEQLYCHSAFITEGKAQKIEDELKYESSKDYFYQYEEVEKGKFHTGKLTMEQQQKFDTFMNKYQHLFAWDPDDFGRTSVIKHSIDTGDAQPIKQRFY